MALPGVIDFGVRNMGELLVFDRVGRVVMTDRGGGISFCLIFADGPSRSRSFIDELLDNSNVVDGVVRMALSVDEGGLE